MNCCQSKKICALEGRVSKPDYHMKEVKYIIQASLIYIFTKPRFTKKLLESLQEHLSSFHFLIFLQKISTISEVLILEETKIA